MVENYKKRKLNSAVSLLKAGKEIIVLEKQYNPMTGELVGSFPRSLDKKDIKKMLNDAKDRVEDLKALLNDFETLEVEIN